MNLTSFGLTQAHRDAAFADAMEYVLRISARGGTVTGRIMAWDDIDLDALRKDRKFSYYFRYPLNSHDFHPMRMDDSLRGHYASKALHSALTPDGRVDRTSTYNGDIASLFVPIEACTPGEAQLLLTHVDPRQIVHHNGTRNWTVIRDAAEACIREALRRDDADEATAQKVSGTISRKRAVTKGNAPKESEGN